MSLKRKLVIICFSIGIMCFSFLALRVNNVNALIYRNADKIERESFLGKYDISLVDVDRLDDELTKVEIEALNVDITLVVNGEEIIVKPMDIGVELDRNSIKSEILNYENNQDYYDKYIRYSKDDYEVKSYELRYVLNEDTLTDFLKELKTSTKKSPKKGELVMNDDKELEYVGEVVGYTLNVKESIEVIKENIDEKEYSKRIVLKGVNSYVEDPYKSINKKISSYTTEFDNTVSRAYNLVTASKRINGVIVEPGEVFSYYKYVGPFNGEGFYYYKGVKGNGVCQVATTLYDAELLAGLKTVARYAHPDMPKYVPGGLDTSVAQFPNYISDFKFQNTYSYPLYISSFINDDKLTVEIWSNENATDGVTYKLRSERRAYASYDAYREHYKDGAKVYDEYLGHSWYYTEVQ